MANSDYKLTLEGPIKVSQLPISDEIAGMILRLLTPLGHPASHLETENNIGQGVTTPDNKKLTPKQFMTLKKPTSDIERVTCLAYYLTHFKNTAVFKTVDLTHLNVEAAQPRMTNPTVAAKNAVAAHYLVLAGGSKRQIGTRGEAVVEALPDRSKVATVLEQHPLRIRKKTTRKHNK